MDRSVLFAVQPLVKAEFHRQQAAIGYLTSVFFIFYMCAAPFMGPLADRYLAKLSSCGRIFWSGATLLTAVTHTFTGLLIRHTLVGIGEASFVTCLPTFVADLFPETTARAGYGRFLSGDSRSARRWDICWAAIWGRHYGWRAPFLCGGCPGFVLALVLLSSGTGARAIRSRSEKTPDREYA